MMDDAGKSAVLSCCDTDGVMTCGVCQLAPSLYTCPRCNVRYCSVTCYKSESHAQCSELFYRNCFTEGLKGMEVDSEARKRMMQLLQTAAGQENTEEEQQELPDDDDEGNSGDVDDAACQLAEIDLNADDVTIWKSLPVEDQRLFVQMLKDGSLAELVVPWQPWWSVALSQQALQLSQPQRTSVPRVLTGLASISRLLAKSPRPADTVRYVVISALYAYAYACRLYNGDHVSLAAESSLVVEAVLCCAEALGVIPDLSTVITSCLTTVSQQPCFVSRQFSVAVMDDVKKIVAMGTVAAALSDCHAIMKKAKREALRGSGGGRSGRGGFGGDGSGRHLSGQDTPKYSPECAAHAKEVCSANDDDVSSVTDQSVNVTESDVDQVKAGESESAGSDESLSVRDQQRTSCFRIQKKLEFLIAWTQEYKALLDDMLPLLELELCLLSSELARHASDKAKVEQLFAQRGNNRDPHRKLIEELETDL